MSDERLAADRPGRGVEDGLERDPPVRDLAGGNADPGGILADLAVTNFFGESTTFYRNLGGAMFADATAAVGLKAPSRFLLGFGAVFLDVDNDGRLDLATANRHIHDLRPSIPYAMPAQLLVGGRDGCMTDVPAGSASRGPSLGSAADWPPPTSTTTAASTCYSSPRTRLWPSSTTGSAGLATSSPSVWRGRSPTATPSAPG
jgi:hypothetical protein